MSDDYRVLEHGMSGTQSKWKHWKLRDWNSALVRRVFSARSGEPPEITRIDATDRFLCSVADANSNESDDIRHSFYGCFKGSVGEVRSLLDYGEQTWHWNPGESQLPFFAQLYLTLLVASADEETYEEGNFRRRLSMSLGFPPEKQIKLVDLPRMWESVMKWSQIQSSSGKAIRRLILPDPKNERQIGYSKRLAFPAHRDQKKLAEILSEKGLDSGSPVEDIRNAILFSSIFSSRFMDEFRVFQTAYLNGDNASAIASPFWGAIEDTTWSSFKEIDASGKLKCRLEIDPTDPYAPGLWLLCSDSQLVKRLGWYKEKLPRIEDGFRYLVSPNSSFDADELADSLVRLGRALITLSKCALARELKSECLGFVRDATGRWVNVGDMPEEGSFWLLSKKNQWRILKGALGKIVAYPDYETNLGRSNEWILAGPFKASPDTREKLSGQLAYVSFFKKRLSRPRIVIDGGVRVSTGEYLFILPLLPVFSQKDAASMEYRILNDNASETSGAVLSKVDEVFVLDAADIEKLGSGSWRVRMRAYSSDKGFIAERVFETTPFCLSTEFRAVPDISRWLMCGAHGQMIVSDKDYLFAESELPNVLTENTFDVKNTRPMRRNDIPHNNPIKLSLDKLPERWLRGLEILSALFGRRYGIPIKEFVEYVGQIWGDDINGGWDVVRNLIDNGYVSRLFARRWRGSILVANPPSIVLLGKGVGRVVGLSTVSLRNRIAEKVDELGGEYFIRSSPDGETPGVMELDVDGDDSLQVIGDAVRLPIGHVCSMKFARLPDWKEIFKYLSVERLPGESQVEKEFWSFEKMGIWSSRKRDDNEISLERWRSEKMQDLYVLRHRNIVWNTRCREWALLAEFVKKNRSIGSISSDGIIRMKEVQLSLPLVVAHAAIVAGGGVCFSDKDGNRVYPVGEELDWFDIVGAWVDDEIYDTKYVSKRLNALQRYRLALKRGTERP